MNVQVIGAGSWGIALARLLARNGHTVRLWGRPEDGLDVLRETRHSPIYLCDIELPDAVEVSEDTDANADMAVFALASHAVRPVAQQHPFSPSTIRVSGAKGIEIDTLQRMTQVLTDVCGACPVVALSGPSHAEEVAQDLPATVAAASADPSACQAVQEAFMGDTFRVYTTPDVVGVELGGSVKNIIAIAAGVCDGFALGDNAKAALITRGLAEISRLGVAMGADPLTFAGLSGMGDLIVTCASRHSRNRAVGERIAQGMTPEQAVAASPMIAEGVRTTKAARVLAERHGVEMPITQQVHAILFENADPRQAVADLMQRQAKPERG